MHLAIDENHRHVLRPLRQKFGVIADVAVAPTDAEVYRDLRDDSRGVFTQVTARLAEHGDAWSVTHAYPGSGTAQFALRHFAGGRVWQLADDLY